jgi:cardiolipin synthase A/B
MAAEVEHWREVFEGALGVPTTTGNKVDILRNGVQIFPAMLDAIKDAEHTVDMLTYVYWSGDIAEQFANALCERAQAGVRVRVLLDAIGAAPMSRDLINAMNDAGCHFEWFRPPTTWKVWEVDHRTHRKVLVCDAKVGFVGGVGIADEWQGDARNPDEWRETHVRIEGPAVDGLRAAFITNWRDTGQSLFDDRDTFSAQEQPGDATVGVLRCPAQVGWTDLHTMFGLLIDFAQHTLNITTAYFVPDDHIREKLAAAGRRGVNVRIMLPGRHADKRVVQLAGEKDYEPLLEAGVRIFNYQRSMLHAKVMTVDNVVATLGSGNMDQRSMRLNEECNALLFDRRLTGVLDRHFEEDLAESEEIDPERWADRGGVQRAKEIATDAIDHKL